MDARPEDISCALADIGTSRATWCGRTVTTREWTFTDATHALLSTASRLRLCPECGAAIAKRAQERVDGTSPEDIATRNITP